MIVGRTLLGGTQFTDDYLWEKVLVAEADISRRLRVYLEPTLILPVGHDPSEEPTDGSPWAEEPAYDYDPDFFRQERWGYIVTREAPVIQVQKIEFSYPAPTHTIMRVPDDWIRLDKQYGHIRLVPASSAFMAPLGAFLMQALGGGRVIPHMIRVTYVTGLQDAATKWPDLVDVILKQAVLNILQDSFLPSSGSISADGLSRSLNIDMGSYQDMIEKKLFGPDGGNGGLQAAIKGIRGMVFF